MLQSPSNESVDFQVGNLSSSHCTSFKLSTSLKALPSLKGRFQTVLDDCSGFIVTLSRVCVCLVGLAFGSENGGRSQVGVERTKKRKKEIRYTVIE